MFARASRALARVAERAVAARGTEMGSSRRAGFAVGARERGDGSDDVDARLAAETSGSASADGAERTGAEARPGRIRSDRLFYPGQAYEAEDLGGRRSEGATAAHTAAGKTVKHPMRGKAVEATLLERATYEDARFLTQFVSDTGKIYPKRRLGVSAKAQRKISRAIKTARQMGILPYTSRLPQFQRMKEA